MALNAPPFWRHDNAIARLLTPFATLYAWASSIKQKKSFPRQINKPVLCVGNLVAGGAGKTPTCLALVDIFNKMGKKAHFLSRGYGGTLREPTVVNRSAHTAQDVGDEALLLATKAPTIVAADKAAGAALASDDADLVILDDGFQNLGLVKTLSLVVVDGNYGIGNGRVMPAGPLREPLDRAMRRADALLFIGDDASALEAILHLRYNLPTFFADLVLEKPANIFFNRPVVAFAGIGRPEKFFTSLEKTGITPVETISFGDHHHYTTRDKQKLERIATMHGAALVTTEKDYVRLPVDFRKLVNPLPAHLVWRNPEAIENFLQRLFNANS
ncbi:MAG: tetraacyldisaccharide 4'-kinase [Holosporales bacterium]